MKNKETTKIKYLWVSDDTVVLLSNLWETAEEWKVESKLCCNDGNIYKECSKKIHSILKKFGYKPHTVNSRFYSKQTKT